MQASTIIFSLTMTAVTLVLTGVQIKTHIMMLLLNMTLTDMRNNVVYNWAEIPLTAARMEWQLILLTVITSMVQALENIRAGYTILVLQLQTVHI